MNKNFDKYWSEYSVVLAFGIILDPTKKLNFLKFFFFFFFFDQQKTDIIDKGKVPRCTKQKTDIS